ncbi:hypothetical protein J1N35_030999 [Gossypium stocksii]|uniref:Uncharacterized protein n=1 Tax=Gossypium stocksii TaxID=47602 RepID=A0A9D3V1L3_9ROSI|nr:hypothetical protein J1N35_030999 [Gossypium stocksii]
MEEQLREFVLDSLGANMEKMNELVNFTTEKLAERDETLEDMGSGERNHEEDEEGHNDDGNSTDRQVAMENHKMRSGDPTTQRTRKCEPKEEAKPIEKKPLKVNSMVFILKKRNGGEGLIFVDINIACQKRSALVDTRASDLFISKKVTEKPGLSIKKSNRKIKTVNFEEALIVGVVRNVELQIGEWKDNGDFETVLYPWADQIHIVTGPLSNIIMAVHQDMKVGTKVLLSIQLVEDASYGRNINSIKRNATKSLSKKLVEHETDMRPVESTVKPSLLGNVVEACLKFLSKEAGRLLAVRSQDVRIQGIPMGISQNWGKLERRLLANEMYQQVQLFKLRGEESQGKDSKGKDNPITRQVRKRPSTKPMTIAQDVPHGGRTIRWGSFSPRELTRFQELLEKPVRLKLDWPDNEDMAT